MRASTADIFDERLAMLVAAASGRDEVILFLPRSYLVDTMKPAGQLMGLDVYTWPAKGKGNANR